MFKKLLYPAISV